MKYHSTSVFSDEPDLEPDLEWMLQSGQVPAGMLAAELIRVYFQDVFHWLLLVLDDPDLAAYTSLDAILAAVLDAYRFPGTINSRVWVFRQAARHARRTLRRSRGIRVWRSLVRRPGLQAPGYSLPQTYLDAAIWLGLDRLPVTQRLAASLAWGLGMSDDAISQILEQPEPETARMLAHARRCILENLATFHLSPIDLPEQDLDLTLNESLGRRHTQLQTDPVEIETLAQEVAAEVSRQASRQSRWARWKEFTWLGILVVLILGVFWVVNLMLPEPGSASSGSPTTQSAAQPTYDSFPAQQVLSVTYYVHPPGESLDEIAGLMNLPSEELQRLQREYSDGILPVGPITIELTPNSDLPSPTPVLPLANRLAPLTVDSSPVEIRNRLEISQTLWKTLWLDSVSFDYGPEGYVGSPHLYRTQSWFSQPDRSLTITWISGGDNTYTVLQRDGLRYTSYQQGGLEVRKAGLGSPGMSLTEEMVFPNRSQIFTRPGQMQILGEDMIAGRAALVVDWRTDKKEIYPNHYRMWVDAQTGIILRFQFFTNQDQDTLLGEVIFARLNLDVDFPQADLFTPWRLPGQVFVNDYRGEQVDASVLPMLTSTPDQAQRSQLWVLPPPGFDPSASRLRFQYEFGLQPSIKPSTVAIFADQYYLGDLQFTDPWSVHCARSPDGRKIAYSFNPYGGPQIGSGWFKLEAPLQVMTGTIGQLYGQFAFSPDSRKLAFFGKYLYTTPGILMIIDTETGQELSLNNLNGASGLVPKLDSSLTSLNNAISLVWSPDGSQIALLAVSDDWSKTSARIVDANSGEQLYMVDVEPTSLWDPGQRGPDWPAPDWPARDWGVAFPSVDQGLFACASPP